MQRRDDILAGALRLARATLAGRGAGLEVLEAFDRVAGRARAAIEGGRIGEATEAMIDIARAHDLPALELAARGLEGQDGLAGAAKLGAQLIDWVARRREE